MLLFAPCTRGRPKDRILSREGYPLNHPAIHARYPAPMIDNIALGISHALLMLAAVMLMRRVDLDREPPKDTRPDA